jgi:hypothetical protein
MLNLPRNELDLQLGIAGERGDLLQTLNIEP